MEAVPTTPPPKQRAPFQEPPPLIRKKQKVCPGCKYGSLGQVAHMGGNGCLPDFGETWEEFYTRTNQ